MVALVLLEEKEVPGTAVSGRSMGDWARGRTELEDGDETRPGNGGFNGKTHRKTIGK